MDILAQVDALTPKDLLPIVQEAVGRPIVGVSAWRHEPIKGGAGALAGWNVLLRLRGQCHDHDGEYPWSAILKIFLAPSTDGLQKNNLIPSTNNLTEPTYWKREVLAFQSGLLKHLPGGLAVPRSYAIWERSDAVWLWMEDIVETSDRAWPLARFGLAARHLGRFNGQYLTDTQVLPAEPWFSRSVVRARSERARTTMATFAESRDDPLVELLCPGHQFDRWLRLMNARHTLLDALDRLPQTLCHSDADRRNLLARRGADGADETVAIDWAFLGQAPVGAEAAPLVGSSVLWFMGVGPEDLPALADIAFEGYLAGLRDVGWSGNPTLARLGFAATFALRYAAFAAAVVAAVPGPAGDNFRSMATAAVGRSIEEILDQGGALLRFALDLGDEAMKLAEAM
jgi:hypothetical protein